MPWEPTAQVLYRFVDRPRPAAVEGMAAPCRQTERCAVGLAPHAARRDAHRATGVAAHYALVSHNNLPAAVTRTHEKYAETKPREAVAGAQCPTGMQATGRLYCPAQTERQQVFTGAFQDDSTGA